MSTLSDVIAAAEAVLSSDADPDQVITLIEAYSSVFQEWFDKEGGSIDQSTPEAATLVEKHRQVLERAHTLQSETSEARRELKKRSKAVISYIDRFPKRISSGSFRKG